MPATYSFVPIALRNPTPQANSSATLCAECDGNASHGPAGVPEPMSLCSGCGIALHATCASRSAHSAHVLPITALVKRGNTWLCNDCLAPGCDGCHTKDAALGLCLLGCCGCTKNFHLGCLDPMPAANTKPKCPWRCRHCMEHHVKAGSRTNVGGRTAGGISVRGKQAAGASSGRRLTAAGHGRQKRYA